MQALAAHQQQKAGLLVPTAARCSFSGRTLAPHRPLSGRTPARQLVVQARKLSHLRKKLWKEAGPPPDLATRLFSERILYLGMPIDSSVAELLTAQLFLLVQEAPDPIYFYINSTGIAKSNTKYGNEHEAIAVYHMMMGVRKFCPIYTLALGNAFGEAALLLSAGSPGKRAALRSSTIMIRQPLQRFVGMQASDIDIYRKVTREKTHTMAKYLALNTKKTEEEITRDFARPRYFTPHEAAAYGLIDTVLEPKQGSVSGKDWESMGSEIGELSVMDDDDQPLPANVMYYGPELLDWRTNMPRRKDLEEKEKLDKLRQEQEAAAAAGAAAGAGSQQQQQQQQRGGGGGEE